MTTSVNSSGGRDPLAANPFPPERAAAKPKAAEKPPRKTAFPVFALQEHIEKALKNIGVGEKKFLRGDRPRDHIYASELGKCQRAVWLAWRRPKPHDEKFEKTRGALGHAIEDMIAGQLEPFLVAREVSFVNDRVSGRADFFVHIDGEQIPVELKSTYGFDKALSEPYPTHVFQLAWYAMQSGAPYGLLIYLNLSNWGGRSGEWVAMKVPRMDLALEKETARLWRVVHREDEPECENPADCFECSLFEGEIDST